MIEDARGNLLEADVEALVNTVNCVGYMGKGIALQFKQAFPENFKFYERACEREEVQPGQMLVFETGSMRNPRYIINFPTKRHWKGKSRYEDIESGLISLVKDVEHLGITTIAVPPLGCGNGGLDWSRVRPMIVEAFKLVPDVEVLLFAPAGAPALVDRVIRTERPKLTAARVLFIKLIEQYVPYGYPLTLLEIHKLAYFLQEGGENLKLNYEQGTYGPYAPNLNKVLEKLEGHFITGYDGSLKPENEVQLREGAVQEADAFARAEPIDTQRISRVAELIAGFESPYGMELLSSVHWVTTHVEPAAKDSETVIERIAAWNERKRKVLQARHIRVAWDRLVSEKWLP